MLQKPTKKTTSSYRKPEVRTPSLPILINNLQKVTYQAKLSADNPEALIGQLIDALSSEDGLVRFIATERLTELSPASVPQLIAALENAHPAIVWGATLILGRLKEQKAVEPSSH